MTKLTLIPDESGYTVEFSDDIIGGIQKGGSARIRRDSKNSPHSTEIQWTLDNAGYLVFINVSRNVIFNGSLPFELDLIIDDNNLTEHTVRQIPGSVVSMVPRGNTRIVAMQILVEPIAL